MPAENTREDDLLTVQEVAKTLKVDPSTVLKWIRDGVLVSVTLPHQVGKRSSHRIRRATVTAILNSHKNT